MRFILFFAAGISVATFTNAQVPVPVLLSSNHYQYQKGLSGAPAFNAVFETATPFQKGFAVVSKDHQYQLINASGQPVKLAGHWAEIKHAPAGYSIAYNNDGDKAIFQGETKVFETKARLLGGSLKGDQIHFQDPETGKMGIVNFRTGKEVLPPRYDFIRPFNDGVAAILEGGSWQLIDISGKAVSPARFEDVGVFSEGLAPARQGGRWGVIDTKGSWVISPQYDHVTEFSAGTAFAQSGDSWKQISKTGKVVRELPYQMIITPSESLFAFMQANRWGYASAETGKVMIAPQYLRAASFENGLALVVRDGAQFYIQPDGTELRVVK